jgi:hypothetical protein
MPKLVRVHPAQHHDPGGQEEQPRMMVIGKDGLPLARTSVITPPRKQETEQHGAPCKSTPVHVRSVIDDVAAYFEIAQLAPLSLYLWQFVNMLTAFSSAFSTIPSLPQTESIAKAADQELL